MIAYLDHIPIYLRNRCVQCDFVAAEASTLLNHVKTVHDRTRDKACPHCEYRCSAPGTLGRHVRTVHERLNKYPCPRTRCEYSATQVYNLRRHLRSVHADGREPEAVEEGGEEKKPICECEMCEKHSPTIAALAIIIAMRQQ